MLRSSISLSSMVYLNIHILCNEPNGVCFFFFVFLFFQAKDGIRDLVRSRGLGDVYKRQTYDAPATVEYLLDQTGCRANLVSVACSGLIESLDPTARSITLAHVETVLRRDKRVRDAPVSSTHLTLPTSDLV